MENKLESNMMDRTIIERRTQNIPSHSTTTQVAVHHFYILDSIEDPMKYIELLQMLRSACENDTIIIHINSHGGRVDIAVQLVAAMKDCLGTVITSLEGRAYSAATLIFLNGHQFNVSDNSNMMVHYYSSYSHGKGNEIETHTFFNMMYFKKLFEETYAGFLSIEEIESVIKGTDVWLESDEIIERLHNFNNHRDSIVMDIRKENVIETLKEIEKTKQALMSELEEMGHDLDDKKKTTKKKTTKKKTTKKKTTKKKTTKK